ncbi:hypothetical protein [Roseovarius nubinhibens]
MKPNFALSLSFDGIGLLRRAYMGWHQVGEVDLDQPDLSKALADLRLQAEKFAPSGFTTKLVIPDGQIKYLDLPTDESWAEDRAGFVAAALDGATPYALSDLAYDWSVSGDRVQIAAVARETLAEAEAFAVEHDFAPVSFVALPAEECFTGEPFFGTTSVVGRYLAEGETVDRDMSRIHVIPVQSAPLDPPAEASPAPAEPETTAEPTLPDQAPDTDAPKITLTLPEVDLTAPAPAKTPAAKPDTPPSTEMRDALAQSLSSDDSAPAAKAGFTSIRAKRGDDAADDAPRLEGVSRLSPLANAAPIAANAAPLAATAASRPAASPRAEATPEATSSGSFFSRRRKASPAKSAKDSAADSPPQARKPARPGTRPRDEEKNRLTVFGAREQQVGGKPRFLGLILTAALIVFLVAVALWASTLDEGLAGLFKDKQAEPTETAALSSQPDPEDPIALATGTQATPARVVRPDPQSDSSQDTSRPVTPVVPVALTADEARARYAATGIWQMAPAAPEEPAATPLGSLGLTSADLPLSRPEPSALLRLAALGDVAPSEAGAVATPAISLDAVPSTGPSTEPSTEPAVAATDTGSETGVRVIAGRPERTPPRDMARPADAASAEATTAETTEATSDTAALGSLAEVAPKLRPEDLATEVETPAANSELAQNRPRLRPQSVVQAAAAQEPEPQPTAEPATPAVDTAAITAAVAAASTANVAAADPARGAFVSPTRQAVQISPQPKPRPRGFADKVERARKVAASTPVPAAQSLAPSRPSAASVSKQATEQNVINLRKVNLIGVYGSANSRRALVRLSNGRYKKVKVGDRLDGGSVSAIGSSELRYVKRGKNVVLTMPRG